MITIRELIKEALVELHAARSIEHFKTKESPSDSDLQRYKIEVNLPGHKAALEDKAEKELLDYEAAIVLTAIKEKKNFLMYLDRFGTASMWVTVMYSPIPCAKFVLALAVPDMLMLPSALYTWVVSIPVSFIYVLKYFLIDRKK